MPASSSIDQFSSATIHLAAGPYLLRIMLWNIQDLGGGFSRSVKRPDHHIKRIASIIKECAPDLCVILEGKTSNPEPKKPILLLASGKNTRSKRDVREIDEDLSVKYEKKLTAYKKRHEAWKAANASAEWPGKQELKEIKNYINEHENGFELTLSEHTGNEFYGFFYRKDVFRDCEVQLQTEGWPEGYRAPALLTATLLSTEHQKLPNSIKVLALHAPSPAHGTATFNCVAQAASEVKPTELLVLAMDSNIDTESPQESKKDASAEALLDATITNDDVSARLFFKARTNIEVASFSSALESMSDAISDSKSALPSDSAITSAPAVNVASTAEPSMGSVVWSDPPTAASSGYQPSIALSSVIGPSRRTRGQSSTEYDYVLQGDFKGNWKNFDMQFSAELDTHVRTSLKGKLNSETIEKLLAPTGVFSFSGTLDGEIFEATFEDIHAYDDDTTIFFQELAEEIEASTLNGELTGKTSLRRKVQTAVKAGAYQKEGKFINSYQLHCAAYDKLFLLDKSRLKLEEKTRVYPLVERVCTKDILGELFEEPALDESVLIQVDKEYLHTPGVAASASASASSAASWTAPRNAQHALDEANLLSDHAPLILNIKLEPTPDMEDLLGYQDNANDSIVSNDGEETNKSARNRLSDIGILAAELDINDSLHTHDESDYGSEDEKQDDGTASAGSPSPIGHGIQYAASASAPDSDDPNGTDDAPASPSQPPTER